MFKIFVIPLWFLSHSGGLRIPSHMTVLHVEQEVAGDATLALASVLEADETRERLIALEREINAELSAGR